MGTYLEKRGFHPNSYSWSETQNMFLKDTIVGLGNGLVPDEVCGPLYTTRIA
ncbi:hypothetical protein Ct9H90mP29_07410 [bacterium]|nr:MAG: hypothetical protein Ct9H90mP29_07410 [bacterium]